MPKTEPSDHEDEAYAGRWVARLRGKIVGQGGTPDAAKLSGQSNRHKERPEISYVRSPLLENLPRVLEKVAACLPNQDLFLVGGAVRDLLVGEASHDFDITVRRDAIGAARRVANTLGADFYVLDASFDTARVLVSPSMGIKDTLDFTSLRGGTDILSDLAARDFTINAIALNLRDKTTLDPCQGASDLKSKILRACGSSAMHDDPIRILRGVRLAAALDLHIDPTTRQWMKLAVAGLGTTSPERIRDELFRMLGGRRPDSAIRALEMLGALARILPELTALKAEQQSLPHVHDVWEHTLAVINNLAEILDLLLTRRAQDANGMWPSLLMLGIGRYREQIAARFSGDEPTERPRRSLIEFAALFHDVGKPSTRSTDRDGRFHFHGHEEESARIAAERCAAFNLSNPEADQVQRLIKHHLRLFFLASQLETEGVKPSRRAIYHFFRDAGDIAVELILLGLADLRGTRAHTLTDQAWRAWIEVARILLENLWERPQETVAPPRLVDGHDLMRELQLSPGPNLGRLLEAIREAQAVGEIHSKADALDFGRRWLRDAGA